MWGFIQLTVKGSSSMHKYAVGNGNTELRWKVSTGNNVLNFPPPVTKFMEEINFFRREK